MSRSMQIRKSSTVCSSSSPLPQLIVSYTEAKTSPMLFSLFEYVSKYIYGQIYFLLFCITCIIDARFFLHTDCKHLSCYVAHTCAKLWTFFARYTTMSNSLSFLFYSSFCHPSEYAFPCLYTCSCMEVLFANCIKSPVYIIHDALALWRRTSGKIKMQTSTTLKVENTTVNFLYDFLLIHVRCD